MHFDICVATMLRKLLGSGKDNNDKREKKEKKGNDGKPAAPQPATKPKKKPNVI